MVESIPDETERSENLNGKLGCEPTACLSFYILNFPHTRLRRTNELKMAHCPQINRLLLTITHYSVDFTSRAPVQRIYTSGDERDDSVASQYGGLEMSSSRFEFAWKSVLFRVF